MNEQEKLDYLAEQQAKQPQMECWRPMLTTEQQAEQEQYVLENNLPF